MKVLKFLGVGLVIIGVVSAVSLSCYAIGGTLLAFLPLWLSKFILGLVLYVLLIIIATIFALGIIKIKEIGGNQ